MKTLGVLFLLLGAVALFAQSVDLTKQNGYDWVLQYTKAQKEQFVSGFMLGAFGAAILTMQFFELSYDETKILWFQDITSSEIIDQVDRYYRVTGDYNTFIYVAIYRRLFLKD